MTRWLACITVLITLFVAAPAKAAVPVYGYKVVHTYPHDTGAYTEGLFYKDGYLFESTGQAGRSTIRKVELKSGEVVQRHKLPSSYFGEGIVNWNNRLVQLTWQSGTGFVYALDSFEQQRTFQYAGEGWGMTRDNQHLYMSDGSPVLRILDPETLAQTGSIPVTAEGEPVGNLNELEWVKGEIYANVWLSNHIARIDPATGHVIGWIDLTGLFDVNQTRDPGNDVLNGIAYDAKNDRLFVTGKHWPKLFEITLVKRR